MTSAPLNFYVRVDLALKDHALGAAMDRATKKLVSSREAGMAAFPEADAVRDHARRIRAHTVGQLGQYLRQFETAVHARGGHVHWAETAEQAVAIVADIARQHDVRSAVKSKSMVSEEIDLNAALARAGVDVLETDLGEFIVQVDKDHPSHIVAPIIHKNRHDIAKSFRGLGATDDDVIDVPQMTAFARRLLRAGFLKADMGISGGNFGVAETGSLCICTNEGNGRLTTTLPRVHVALMGIERLVPTLSDLDVMLQLLGRSATGQKLTVYTNIISGPRRGAQGATGATGATGAWPDAVTHASRATTAVTRERYITTAEAYQTLRLLERGLRLHAVAGRLREEGDPRATDAVHLCHLCLIHGRAGRHQVDERLPVHA
jgi:L-lactate dehydrogenase complex protein LldF